MFILLPKLLREVCTSPKILLREVFSSPEKLLREVLASGVKRLRDVYTSPKIFSVNVSGKQIYFSRRCGVLTRCLIDFSIAWWDVLWYYFSADTVLRFWTFSEPIFRQTDHKIIEYDNNIMISMKKMQQIFLHWYYSFNIAEIWSRGKFCVFWLTVFLKNE